MAPARDSSTPDGAVRDIYWSTGGWPDMIGKRTKTATALRGRWDGRGGEIRTHDPLYPKQVRYQTAPRPGPCVFLTATY